MIGGTKLFGRVWSVQIDRTDFTGLDMSFSIHKTLKPHPNTCELKLFNLSDDARSALEKTPLVKLPVKGKGAPKFQHEGIPVRITAGYEGNESLIWSGDLRTVESEHDGADWITTLTSGDGEQAYQKSRVNLSFGPGTPIVTVVKKLAAALGVGAGNVDVVLPLLAANPSLAALSAQGIVLSGSAAEQLTHITRSVGFEWSIQSGALQFVEHGEPAIGQVVLLSPATGLVGAPSVDQEQLLTAKMLMMPNVTPGSLLVLDSERHKGNYRIQTATYEGDTSGQPWYVDVTAAAI